jgi:hypothetical protein
MTIKKSLTGLAAAAALTLVAASSVLARCNPVPTVNYFTDGTVNGTFAIIHWDACDATSWEVCHKVVRPFSGDDGQAIDPFVPDCETVVGISSYRVDFRDGDGNYNVRWLDGDLEGRSYRVRVDFPEL